MAERASNLPFIDLNAERYARGLRPPKPAFGMSPANDLSFVKKLRDGDEPGSTDYWAIEDVPKRATEWKTGEALADEFLSYLPKCPFGGHLLSSIACSMAKKGRGKKWSAANAAFFHRISRYARAAAIVIEYGAPEC